MNCFQLALFKEKYSLIVMFFRILAKSKDRPMTNGAVAHVDSERNKPFESRDWPISIMSSCGLRILAAIKKKTAKIMAAIK